MMGPCRDTVDQTSLGDTRITRAQNLFKVLSEMLGMLRAELSVRVMDGFLQKPILALRFEVEPETSLAASYSMIHLESN